jgi:hypothetical protein
MEMYDCSKATALKLERQGKLTPYTFTGDRRKIYYDLKEIESIFELPSNFSNPEFTLMKTSWERSSASYLLSVSLLRYLTIFG